MASMWGQEHAHGHSMYIIQWVQPKNMTQKFVGVFVCFVFVCVHVCACVNFSTYIVLIGTSTYLIHLIQISTSNHCSPLLTELASCSMDTVVVYNKEHVTSQLIMQSYEVPCPYLE